jgi:L-asparaginase/Glu-tRNA(Gln) amidotransferase subunit D
MTALSGGIGRRSVHALLMLCAMLFVGAASPAWAQQRPHVLVIATGGTIASASSGPALTGEALVTALPALDKVATLTVEDLAAGGSSGLKRADWARLVRRIRAAFAADPALAGIVVTHGTDTMEETAFLLDLVIADQRPVILTGSMRSSNAVSADGPANLLEAVRVAADPRAHGRGVLVALDNQILSASDAAKLSTSRTSAFASPNQGPVGAVLDDDIRFFQPAGRSGRIYDLSPERIDLRIVEHHHVGAHALAAPGRDRSAPCAARASRSSCAPHSPGAAPGGASHIRRSRAGNCHRRGDGAAAFDRPGFVAEEPASLPMLVQDWRSAVSISCSPS